MGGNFQERQIRFEVAEWKGQHCCVGNAFGSHHRWMLSCLGITNYLPVFFLREVIGKCTRSERRHGGAFYSPSHGVGEYWAAGETSHPGSKTTNLLTRQSILRHKAVPHAWWLGRDSMWCWLLVLQASSTLFDRRPNHRNEAPTTPLRPILMAWFHLSEFLLR